MERRNAGTPERRKTGNFNLMVRVPMRFSAMKQPVSNVAERARVAAAMNALAHQRRVVIFEILRNAADGLPYGALLERAGLSLSTLNHHLGPMRAAGLVVTRRKGHEVIYRLAP